MSSPNPSPPREITAAQRALAPAHVFLSNSLYFGNYNSILLAINIIIYPEREVDAQINYPNVMQFRG